MRGVTAPLEGPEVGLFPTQDRQLSGFMYGRQPNPQEVFGMATAAGIDPREAGAAAGSLAQALQVEQGSQSWEPVERTYNGQKFLVNPKTGNVERDLTEQQGQMPEGFVPLGASVDENGKLDVRWGPPKAEGKALTQEEVGRIASLNQAENDLNVLEKLYAGMGAGYGGPVSGRIKSLAMAGQNPNIAAMENAITAATPNLARGVFREVGVLTDQDIARYQRLLPSPTDTDEVRKRKVKQLRDRIAIGRKQMIGSLKSAGRDVAGFSDESATEEDGEKYDSEAEARAAGHSAESNPVVMIYDPATAKYRKARLK
jgi:hypothetical protein